MRRGERGLCGEKKKKNVQTKTTVLHRINTFALYVGNMRLRNASDCVGQKNQNVLYTVHDSFFFNKGG